MNQRPEYNALARLCVPTMLSVLKEYFASDDILSMNASLNLSEGQLVNFAQNVLLEDLNYDIINLAEKDPAAGKTQDKAKYVWDAYKGLKAIMYYRIANHLLDFQHNCLMTKSSFDSDEDAETIRDYMRLQARKISERAATETTIEINPAAQIGKGFVIDHGVGTKIAPGVPKFSTVIGETCIIGEDCTLLNSVLLGAAVINEASTGKEGVAKGKRHPTLGNRVTVCAGVRILGNITVGDDVTIGPCCVITNDIPAGYNVTIVNQLQYSRPDSKYVSSERLAKPSIYGLNIEKGEDTLHLFGRNLPDCSLSIVTFEEGIESEVEGLIVELLDSSPTDIVFRIDVQMKPATNLLSLRIKTASYEYVLTNPQAIGLYIGRKS